MPEHRRARPGRAVGRARRTDAGLGRRRPGAAATRCSASCVSSGPSRSTCSSSPARARARPGALQHRPGGRRGRLGPRADQRRTRSTARTAATTSSWPRRWPRRRPKGIDPPRARPTTCATVLQRTLAEICGLAQRLLPRPRRLDAPAVERGRRDGHQRHRRRRRAAGGRASPGPHQHAGTDAVSVTYFGDGAVNIGSDAGDVQPRRGLAAAGLLLHREQPVRGLHHRRRGDRRAAAVRARARASASPAGGSTAWTRSPCTWRCSEAVEHMRAGDGPTVVEADVYRYFHQNGPFPGSAFGYRTKEEEQSWRARDPLDQVARPAACAAASSTEAELGRASRKRSRRAMAEIGGELLEPVPGRQARPAPDPARLVARPGLRRRRRPRRPERVRRRRTVRGARRLRPASSSDRKFIDVGRRRDGPADGRATRASSSWARTCTGSTAAPTAPPRGCRRSSPTGSSAPRSARTRSPASAAASRWTAGSARSSSSCTPTSCGSPPTSCSTRSARPGTCSAATAPCRSCCAARSRWAPATAPSTRWTRPASSPPRRAGGSSRRRTPFDYVGLMNTALALQGPGASCSSTSTSTARSGAGPGRRPRLLPPGRQGRGPARRAATSPCSPTCRWCSTSLEAVERDRTSTPRSSTCAGSTGRASTGTRSARASARPTTCSSSSRAPLGTSYGGWLADEIQRRFFDWLDQPIAAGHRRRGVAEHQQGARAGRASPSTEEVAAGRLGSATDRGGTLRWRRLLRMPEVAAGADRGGAVELVGRRGRRPSPRATRSPRSRPRRRSSTSRPRATACVLAHAGRRRGRRSRSARPIARARGARRDRRRRRRRCSPSSASAGRAGRRAGRGSRARGAEALDRRRGRAVDRGAPRRRGRADGAPAHRRGSSPARWRAGWPARPGSTSTTSPAPGPAAGSSARDVERPSRGRPRRPARRRRPRPPPLRAGRGAGRGYAEDVPHTRMRRADRRAGSPRASTTAPHFYLRGTRARRRAARAARASSTRRRRTRVSVNDLVVKAVGRGARATCRR